MSSQYLSDNRYPGPSSHPPPPHIRGIPSQAELDSYPRMFTWGELKQIIQIGELEQLMRNKEMQARYDAWSAGMRKEYGSTEKYLTGARLPWKADHTPPGGSPLAAVAAAAAGPSSLTPATDPLPPPGRGALAPAPVSGSSTPSSVGFVSLSSIKLGEKLRAAKKKAGEPDSPVDDEPEDVFLRFDPSAGLDHDKYAVLPNDWPYNVPYGVRHFCVWSRVPIAHPKLVDYDAEAWAVVEDKGLGGFTGITPIIVPIPGTPIRLPGPVSGSESPASRTPTRPTGRGGMADLPLNQLLASKSFVPKYKKGEWYAVDNRYGGPEMRRWAGVEYESPGGSEVGKMVCGLWDPRGWECLWFVNPPRLQSVPGFSHFHVFARRKTPEEIDACEAIWGTAPEPRLSPELSPSPSAPVRGKISLGEPTLNGAVEKEKEKESEDLTPTMPGTHALGL